MTGSLIIVVSLLTILKVEKGEKRRERDMSFVWCEEKEEKDVDEKNGVRARDVLPHDDLTEREDEEEEDADGMKMIMMMEVMVMLLPRDEKKTDKMMIMIHGTVRQQPVVIK